MLSLSRSAGWRVDPASTAADSDGESAPTMRLRSWVRGHRSFAEFFRPGADLEAGDVDEGGLAPLAACVCAPCSIARVGGALDEQGWRCHSGKVHRPRRLCAARGSCQPRSRGSDNPGVQRRVGRALMGVRLLGVALVATGDAVAAAIAAGGEFLVEAMLQRPFAGGHGDAEAVAASLCGARWGYAARSTASSPRASSVAVHLDDARSDVEFGGDEGAAVGDAFRCGRTRAGSTRSVAVPRQARHSIVGCELRSR